MSSKFLRVFSTTFYAFSTLYVCKVVGDKVLVLYIANRKREPEISKFSPSICVWEQIIIL